MTEHADKVGPRRMRMEADRLRRMYRNRQALREELERLMNEYGDGTAANTDGTEWTCPRSAGRAG